MSHKVQFIFDFGSPNAYLVYHTLQPMLDRVGATMEIVPVLLGGIFKATKNTPPMINFAEVAGKNQMFMREIERFVERHELTRYRFNSHFPVNTLLLMRGMVAYSSVGNIDDYARAGLQMMWEDGKKMDDPGVFVEAFTESGFDGSAILASTQNQVVKDQLIANTQMAVDNGVFGVPTFLVGKELFFGKDHLDELEWWLKR